MTQRLVLHHILKNQIEDYTKTMEEGRELARASRKEKAALAKGSRTSTMYSRYFAEKPDIKTTFDNIVANIHTSMKATRPPQKSVPTIPKPITDVPAVAEAAQLKKSGKGRSKGGRRIKGGQNGRDHIVSIPAIKASLDQKTQKMMKRGYSDLNPKTFVNQKRIREVLQQKSVLESMLMEHKRLQRDRQSIALDIQRMRADLDRIRNKLDTSLQSLNSTRTMFSGTLKAKNPPSRSSSGVHSSRPRTIVKSKHRVSARPRAKNVSTARSSNVTLKRQHVASSKRRA